LLLNCLASTWLTHADRRLFALVEIEAIQRAVTDLPDDEEVLRVRLDYGGSFFVLLGFPSTRSSESHPLAS
jgi:hypothetical protein